MVQLEIKGFIGETEGVTHSLVFLITREVILGVNLIPLKCFQQLQEIFHGPTSGVFPFDDSKPNSGIPVIVGALVVGSLSMGDSWRKRK